MSHREGTHVNQSVASMQYYREVNDIDEKAFCMKFQKSSDREKLSTTR